MSIAVWVWRFCWVFLVVFFVECFTEAPVTRPSDIFIAFIAMMVYTGVVHIIDKLRTVVFKADVIIEYLTMLGAHHHPELPRPAVTELLKRIEALQMLHGMEISEERVKEYEDIEKKTGLK